MIKGKISIVTLCLLLAGGCAVNSSLEAGMESFVGKSADSTIKALGFPHADEQIAGKRVLVWTAVPSRSLSNDYPDYHHYYGISLHGSGYRNYGCTLRVILDKNDVVESWDSQGSLSNCGKYRKILQERGEIH